MEMKEDKFDFAQSAVQDTFKSFLSKYDDSKGKGFRVIVTNLRALNLKHKNLMALTNLMAQLAR